MKATAFLSGSDEVDVGDEMVREGLAVYLSEAARPHTPSSHHSEASEEEGDSPEAPIPAADNKVPKPLLLMHFVHALTEMSMPNDSSWYFDEGSKE